MHNLITILTKLFGSLRKALIVVALLITGGLLFSAGYFCSHFKIVSADTITSCPNPPDANGVVWENN